MSRQDQYNVTVTIDAPGLGALNTFDDLTGGAGDSEEIKYRSGNMGGQTALGGPPIIDNVVVMRLFVLERDHPLLPFLMAARGKATMTVVKQPLDVNKVPFGAPNVYHGKLKRVTPTEARANQGGTAAMLELEQSTESMT